LFFVVLEAAVCMRSPVEILDLQSTFALILAAIYTFVSVNSFLTEKKSGALELLLVTPVSPDAIIFGRVWGLWLQFLPSAAALLLCRIGAENLVAMTTTYTWQARMQNNSMLWNNLTMPVSWGIGHDVSAWGQIHSRPLDALSSPDFQVFVIAVGFLTLPVFATYFALRVKNLWAAAALTWLALLLCPYFAFTLMGAASILGNVTLGTPIMYQVILLTNLAFALLACYLLHHSLSRRIYSF
jgi:ABC-type Na+ efflux pump permease subunit